MVFIITGLALSNGLNPAGAILLSIYVRRKTLVARSFQGRPNPIVRRELHIRPYYSTPRKHCSAVTVVALASGDWITPMSRTVLRGIIQAHANNPRICYVRPVTVPRSIGQVCTLPCDNTAATRSIRKRNILEPTVSRCYSKKYAITAV